MSVNDTSTNPAGGHLAAKALQAKEALLTLQPKAQHQKAELFTLLYPTIVELLNKHVSQKAILDMLQTQGLKLHPSRFKGLMAAHAMAARSSQDHRSDEEGPA